MGESGISLFFGDIRDLFGAWIAEPCAPRQQETDQPDLFVFDEEAEPVGHAPAEAVLGDAFAFEEEAVLGSQQESDQIHCDGFASEVLSGDVQSEHAFSFQDEAVLGDAEPEIAFSFEDEVVLGSQQERDQIHCDGFASEVLSGDAQPEADPSINPWLLDFRGSMYISGMLHILSNLTKDIPGALLHWMIFLDDLRHVCRLLNHKWSKQRFKEHLLNDAPWSYFQKDIQTFEGGVS